MGVDKNVECQQTNKRYGMLRVGKNVATYSAEPRGRRNIRGRPGGLIHLIRVIQVEMIPASLEDDKPLEITLYLHKTKVVQPKTEPTTYMKATLEWIIPPSSFTLTPSTVIPFPIPLTPCG